jgi:translocation and assembly module TamB
MAAFLIAAGTAAVAWLAGTTEGARWLLAVISRHSQAKITAVMVEGRLLDHLRLTGVRISSAQVVTEMDSLDLRCSTLYLLIGKIAIQELSLQRVQIIDNSPPSGRPPDLAWPRVSGIPALLEGNIAMLRVNGLTYRRQSGEPLTVDSISTSVEWRYRLLSLSDLSVVTPSGSLKGKITAGFSRPFLKTDLVLAPALSAANLDHLSIQSRFSPGRGPEQLAGSFAISVGSGSRQRLELSGESGMTRHSLNIRKLRLTGLGRRGAVTGEGNVNLAASEPSLTLKLSGSGLDLSQETGMTTDLNFELDVTGNIDKYRGSFSFANRGKGWRSGTMTSKMEGNRVGMKLTALNGRILEGAVLGELGIDWQKGIKVDGTVSGSNLNAARIDSGWKGVLNFDLSGNIARQGAAPPSWDLDARLRQSRLHGQELTGEVRAGSVAGNLLIERLLLRGKGFDIHGAGELKSRVELAARVSDLSRLVPGAAGEIKADGWVRWNKGSAGGSVSLHGTRLAAGGISAAALDLAARLDEGKGYPLHAKAKFRGVSSKGIHVDSATLAADGTLLNHTLAAVLFADGAEVRLSLSGGYGKGLWQGDIVRLSGKDGVGPWEMEKSARLSVSSSRIFLSPIVIHGVKGERLEAAAELVSEPRRGELRLEWGALNLSRVSRWMKGVSVTGSSSGMLRLTMPGGERLVLTGNASAGGVVTLDGKSVTVRRSTLKINGNEQGIRAGLETTTGNGGVLTGSFTSSAPARLGIPEQGEFRAEWKGFDLALLRPWLPGAVKVDGLVAGKAKGRLFPGHHLEMEGEAALSQGKAHWRNPEGEIKANIRSATVNWIWRGETLNGNAELLLAEYGEARGSFRLPLPARLPVSNVPSGGVQASLTGKVREMGVLTALFPGVIRESSGEMDADLMVSGRWDEPRITGNLHLGKAGAYLPTAGIHVKDVQFSAHLERELIRIDFFRAASGPGHLEGSADITMKGWRITGYRGKIGGERFQTVYFPELQLQCTPSLNFEGTPEKLSVRGEVRLPELLINGPPTSKVVEPSRDVIVEGRQKPAAKGSTLALDVKVRMVLGDKVLVKTAGIDAQLAGSMDLTFTTLDRITSKGEIRVVKGSYRTYGVDLEIVRGRLYYAGGPINRPTLDFLALRTVGEVRAGVTVGGVLQSPVTKLYSDPSMPDVDILAYIVLGHPLSSASSTSQTALLAQAAGALLSASQATDLRGEIKSRLGLSSLGFETSSASTTGSISYKAIPATPRGMAPRAPTASDSLLTVGKYLTPQLYLSYGRSIFTGGNLFRIRYDIFKHWQIETQTGAESGGDIFYTIDFN